MTPKSKVLLAGATILGVAVIGYQYFSQKETVNGVKIPRNLKAYKDMNEEKISIVREFFESVASEEGSFLSKV